LATGEGGDIPVKAIGSSDFTFYLAAPLRVGALIADVFKKLIDCYRSMLEVREMKERLENVGISENAIAMIMNDTAEMMNRFIEEQSNQLIRDTSVNIDSGRKKELKTKIKASLRRSAKRIDIGYSFSVRVKETQDTNKSKEPNENINMINSANETLRYVRLTGKPILMLSEDVKAAKKEE